MMVVLQSAAFASCVIKRMGSIKHVPPRCDQTALVTTANLLP